MPSSSSPLINPLLEESTINPSSTLPSYLEMKMLQATVESSRQALNTAIDALSQNMTMLVNSNSTTHQDAALLLRLKYKILKIISIILRKYPLEIQLLLKYSIERKALMSSSNSTLSEAMFGFRRSKVSHSQMLKALGKNDMIKTALLLSFGSYIDERLRRYYQKLRDSFIDDGGDNMSMTPREEISIGKIMKKTFVYLYPFLHMTKEGLNIAYNFMYMINKSPYYSPTLHALGQIIRRTNMLDNNARKQEPKHIIGQQNNSTTIQRIMNKAAGPVSFSLFSLFCIGWIGQFRRELRNRRRRLIVGGLENNNLSRRNENYEYEKNKISVPPPVPSKRVEQNELNLSRNPALCPLCSEKRVNPTATCSGFVFCFRCISLFLRKNNHKCPITGMKCRESQLVRIYESTG